MARLVLAARRAGGLLLLGVLPMTSPNAGAADQATSPPIFRSYGSQFTFVRPASPVPATPVRELDGRVTNLMSFRGRVVVLNFWATWCPPCIYELPSLDQLAATTNPRRLAVLAISIDRNGAAAVAPFVASHRLTHLMIGLDPRQYLGSLNTDNVAMGALPLWGLPISYIIDPKGYVVGYLAGAARWDSPQAKSFLRYFEHNG